MASVRLGAALRQIHGLFEAGTVAGLTDGQLLDRYLTRRDESAFAALVMRHGPMVLGVCHAVLHGRPEVEDAFQATFLVLIRKASTIRGRDAIGGWLYRVAHRVAVQAGHDRLRRARREHPVGEPGIDIAAGDPAVDDEWCGTLHEELTRLPERLRLPVVLCYLEGRTHAQAAIELRWSEATLRRRLADARELLRARLTRRGVAVSVAALAAALESPAIAAVPAAWLQTLVSIATAPAGAVPAAEAARLAGRTIRGLLAGRVRTVVHVVTLLVTTAFLAGHLVPAGPARADDRDKGKMAAASSKQAGAPGAQRADDKPAREDRLTIRGRVLDSDGKPFAGARVYAYVPDTRRSSDAFFGPAPSPNALTGADGRFQFAIPYPGFPKDRVQERWEAPVVTAMVRGFGPAWATIASADEARDLALRLVKDDVPIVGRILDLEGRPVAGVTVRPVILSASSSGDLTAWEAAMATTTTIYDKPGLHHTLVPNLELYRWDKDFAVTTGADGRFRMTGIGRERVVSLWIEGPTIATEFTYHHARTRPGPTYKVIVEVGRPEFGTIVYHGSTFEYAAAPTRPIEGTVRDKLTGRPIAGISIRSHRFAGNPINGRDHVRTTTGPDGRYRLVGMPPGAGNVIMAKAGPGQPYRTSVRTLSDGPGTGPITEDFTLERTSVTVRGKVTDKATGRPLPAAVQYFVFVDNPHRGQPLSLGGGEVSTRPDGSFELNGVPGRGLVAARALKDLYLVGQGADKIAGASPNGTFPTDPHICESQRVHALVAIDPAEDATSVTCNLALDPGLKLSGTAVGPDGQPLTGCLVYHLYPHTMSINLQKLTSGAFTAGALDPRRPRPLFFRHEERNLAGMMIVRGDEKGSTTVRLEPAGTVIGRLVDDHGDPRTDVRVHIRHAEGQFRPEYDSPLLEPKLDRDGRFRVEGMTPGVTYDLHAIAGFRLLGQLATGVKLQPGETRDLGDLKVKRSQ